MCCVYQLTTQPPQEPLLTPIAFKQIFFNVSIYYFGPTRTSFISFVFQCHLLIFLSVSSYRIFKIQSLYHLHILENFCVPFGHFFLQWTYHLATVPHSSIHCLLQLCWLWIIWRSFEWFNRITPNITLPHRLPFALRNKGNLNVYFCLGPTQICSFFHTWSSVSYLPHHSFIFNSVIWPSFYIISKTALSKFIHFFL